MDGTPTDALTRRTVEILARLVGFDTVSRNSNLALIDWVEGELAALAIPATRIPDETGEKASLLATIGPADRPGYVLSGHTDVVPVDDQDWSSDPFTATVRDGRVYGRGTCDMKGFLAAMLAMAPAMAAAPLARPIHLAFSYDEEVGCVGVQPMLHRIAGWPTRPLGCFVGEPTGMEVITAHKAKRTWRVTARGTAAHSSLAPTAVNATHFAARLIAHIADLADDFAATGARDPLYDIPHTTPHVGPVAGGKMVNIVPDRCSFTYEVRAIAEDDPDAICAGIEAHARSVLEPAMQAIDPAAGFDFERVSAIDGLETDPGAEVVALAKRFSGRNAHAKVAYGTEGGFFTSIAGIPAVVVGPGSIAQAHKADEFVEIAELARANAFIAELIAHCRA